MRTEAMRTHARPLLLWFTRGQGRLTIDGMTRGFGPHNAVFIPPGTMYGFSLFGQVQGVGIFFPVNFANELPDDPLHMRLRDGAAQSDLHLLIEALEREAVKEDGPVKERAMTHWGSLISIWLERNADHAEAPSPQTAAQKIFAAYSALVERDFRSGRGVSGYAEHLGITPTHLNRVCRNSAGKSASRMIAERVNNEAKRLLRESSIPIKDVARSLGFNSAAYFSRAFLHETGKSPSNYRKGL